MLGEFTLFCEGDTQLLFTENETNHERLFPGQKNESPYVKDGVNDWVVQGRENSVNPAKEGTKVAAHYRVNIGAGQTQVIRLRLSRGKPDQNSQPFGKPFDQVFADRLCEADEFYKSVTPPSASTDEANVMRQALAGMLWSKQFFFFDGDNWLDEHNSTPLHSGYRLGQWRHSCATEEKEAPVAAMTAAVLGLLAFMLAFTFNMAASRFDARRQAVLDEANAIGTTYLRTRLLPEPQRSEIARLLTRYTELRTQRMTAENIGDLLAESEKLHKQMWSQAVAAAETNSGSITTGLFLESLNESIDLHSTRVFVGLYSRIPITIWLMLLSLVVLGMISLGYQAGLSATRRSLEMPIFAMAFTGVLYLIVDLDRAHEGLLQISQQAMVNLHNSMQATQP